MTKRILAVIMMLTVMLAFISCGKIDDDIPEGLQKSENIESVPWYIIASFSSISIEYLLFVSFTEPVLK